MPKANFYLLKQTNTDAVRALCCKLAEQQSKQGQRVQILTASAEAAQEMDQLLWAFAPDSFLPHALANSEQAAQATIVIGHNPHIAGTTTCVLNLGESPVAAGDKLAAIAEFVLNDEDAKAQSRVRWNHYKQLGYELQLHQL